MALIEVRSRPGEQMSGEHLSWIRLRYGVLSEDRYFFLQILLAATLDRKSIRRRFLPLKLLSSSYTLVKHKTRFRLRCYHSKDLKQIVFRLISNGREYLNLSEVLFLALAVSELI